MHILFENYYYQATELEGIIPKEYIHLLPGNQAQVTHIGYLGSMPGIESIIILPKVFLNQKNLVFNKYSPSDLIELSKNPNLRLQLQQSGKMDFFFRISLWLYRAIGNFERRNPKTNLISTSDLNYVHRQGKQDGSALELVQSLKQFNRDNQVLMSFIKRQNIGHKGFINWAKTMNTQVPLVQNTNLLYDKVVRKNQIPNVDEELLRIYISTLAEIKNKFGFKIDISSLYQKLPENEFQKFKRDPLRQLKKIRGRYFNDKLVKLWQLLYLYYDNAQNQKSENKVQHQLLVRDFNIVFEDMVDLLLSDPPSSRQPQSLKQQFDGKIVDHIFEFNSLIGADDTIYYIGDSKYYKSGAHVGNYSIYKQYTYARNIIFENISRLSSKSLPAPIRYRDSLTEGYNPTPNFFLSANVHSELIVDDPQLVFVNYYKPATHFSNRLFDRDTLLLQHYKINFLYVLAAYVTPHSIILESFRDSTRKTFRTSLIFFLNLNYTFFEVYPLTLSIDLFVKKHFKLLIGKMYRPSKVENSILLAILNDQESEISFLNEEALLKRYIPK